MFVSHPKSPVTMTGPLLPNSTCSFLPNSFVRLAAFCNRDKLYPSAVVDEVIVNPSDWVENCVVAKMRDLLLCKVLFASFLSFLVFNCTSIQDAVILSSSVLGENLFEKSSVVSASEPLDVVVVLKSLATSLLSLNENEPFRCTLKRVDLKTATLVKVRCGGKTFFSDSLAP